MAELREEAERAKKRSEEMLAKQEKRHKEIEEIQKRLAHVNAILPPPRPRRTSQVDVEDAKLALLRATGMSRPNHKWAELNEGHGCVKCETSSPFRRSRVDHLFLIQEEP